MTENLSQALTPLNGEPKKEKRKRAADVLEEFLASQQQDRITMSDFIAALGHRAFGIAIFILALANLLIANVPGISTVLGLPVILFSLQLFLGQKTLWLPKKFKTLTLQRKTLEKMIRRSVRVLRKVEVFIRPRITPLVDGRIDRLIGFYCLVLGIVLALPILFGNWLPSWALAFIALGMIERDGLAAIVGFLIGLLAIAYSIAFYSGFIYLFDWLMF